MAASSKEFSISERFRVGRWVLDGATFEWLAERTGQPLKEVAEAWEFCRAEISRHLAESAGVEFRALSDKELKSDAERFLRLLLDWQETIDRNAHFEAAVNSLDLDDRIAAEPAE